MSRMGLLCRLLGESEATNLSESGVRVSDSKQHTRSHRDRLYQFEA